MGHARIMRPWLHPEIIYNLTSGKIRQNHITSVTTTFIKDVRGFNINKSRIQWKPLIIEAPKSISKGKTGR